MLGPCATSRSPFLPSWYKTSIMMNHTRPKVGGRRLLPCAAAMLTVVSLLSAGCSSQPANSELKVSEAGGEAQGAKGASGEKLRVAFITNQIADFWKISEAGCLDAEKDFGVEVEVRMPAQATAVEQKRIVEDLLTGGVQAIAISPIDAENQIDWLNAIAGRVPLITHDSDAPASNRLLYIGMDNYAAGRACGELVKKALPEGGEVMLFIGRLEQDNSKYRRQGVIDVLMDRDRDLAFYRSQPNAWDPTEGPIQGEKYTVLGTLTDQGKPDVAQTKAEDSINSYPELDAMVGLFEYNPPACFQAIEKAGKRGQIRLIGFDENDVTLQAIKDGHCTGTVVQNPYQYGYESVRALKAILEKQADAVPPGKYLDIPPRTITVDNVDEYWTDLKAKKGQ
jgi:ribose transport system substrate-binding protein